MTEERLTGMRFKQIGNERKQHMKNDDFHIIKNKVDAFYCQARSQNEILINYLVILFARIDI